MHDLARLVFQYSLAGGERYQQFLAADREAHLDDLVLKDDLPADPLHRVEAVKGLDAAERDVVVAVVSDRLPAGRTHRRDEAQKESRGEDEGGAFEKRGGQCHRVGWSQGVTVSYPGFVSFSMGDPRILGKMSPRKRLDSGKTDR